MKKLYISNLNSYSLMSTNSSQKSIFNANKIHNINIETPTTPLNDNSILVYDSQNNLLKK